MIKVESFFFWSHNSEKPGVLSKLFNNSFSLFRLLLKTVSTFDTVLEKVVLSCLSGLIAKMISHLEA